MTEAIINTQTQQTVPFIQTYDQEVSCSLEEALNCWTAVEQRGVLDDNINDHDIMVV
jgi:hypothetical protein